MIFHLALAAHLAHARESGLYRWSTLERTLEQEGFVHACFADQVRGVAERHYRGVTGPLVLLAVDEARLTDPVRVENGFPHVYGPIPLSAVVAQAPVATGPDGVPDVEAALDGLPDPV